MVTGNHSTTFTADASKATESLLWVAVHLELEKATPLGLITAFMLLERWIENNRTQVAPAEIVRVLDHFEELISE